MHSSSVTQSAVVQPHRSQPKLLHRRSMVLIVGLATSGLIRGQELPITTTVIDTVHLAPPTGVQVARPSSSAGEAAATPILPDSRLAPAQTAGLKNVPLYGIYELVLLTTKAVPVSALGLPKLQVRFTGISGPAQGEVLVLHAFADGSNRYRVRFMVTAWGEWGWQTIVDDQDRGDYTGRLRCTGRLPATHASVHGWLRNSEEHPYTFVQAEGAPVFLVGDTQWSFGSLALAWPAEFAAYAEARAAQGFNYVQGRLFDISPEGNDRNEGGPAFLGNAVDSLNPAYWQMLDRRIAHLNARGMVVGLVLGWPGTTWPLFTREQQVRRYLAHVVSRYAAYNVIWITSGEYEQGTPPTGHAYLGEWLQAHDPYHHPITTHTLNTSADDFGTAPWQTAIYQQTNDPAQISIDRRHGKPVINSGFGWEGVQTADEVRKDAWQIVMRGGFFVYGNRLTSDHNAVLTPGNLASPGAVYVQYLKNFWTDNDRYDLQWWRFTTFQDLGNSRWLAGTPGVGYVVYAEPREDFFLTLPERRSNVQGDWYETRSGRWRTPITGVTTAPLTLRPPNGGCVAYFTVTHDSTPPVISGLQITDVTANSATVRWQTDEKAGSEIQYGAGTTLQYTLRDSTLATQHQFTLQQLSPRTRYRLRVHTRDALGNASPPRDTSFTTGPEVFTVGDDFNRSEIGGDWTLEASYWHIEDGELDLNAGAQGGWRYLAVYNKLPNGNGIQIIEMSYRWGKRADAGGVREGAAAIMLDANSTQASGYWIWHRYGHVWLWAINQGSYVGATDLGRWPGARDPSAGDLITIKIRQEPRANYFDYYINGKLAATAFDTTKMFPKSEVWYAGFFRYGQDINNQTDDFALKYIRTAGNEQLTAAVRQEHSSSAGSDPTAGLPKRFLLASYPNPVTRGNGTGAHAVTVEMLLPHAAQVNVQVLDVIGRVVGTLADGPYAAGRHRLAWQAHNEWHQRVAPGTYFVRLRYRETGTALWSQTVNKLQLLR